MEHRRKPGKQPGHWEIGWTTARRLSDEEVRSCVEALSGLGCSLPAFDVETEGDGRVSIRHRQLDGFRLEFGFAGAGVRPEAVHGLVRDGHIAWNWCRTDRRQPETGLILKKFRQLQGLTGDKLLVWDDDGVSHWSWGSCRLEEAGVDPLAVVDEHLRNNAPPALPKAS